MELNNQVRIAVVIPTYRVKKHILDLIRVIPTLVCKIYVVDDACSEYSGDYVLQSCIDPRVQVLWHKENQGVGGAVMTGYRAAIDDGMDVIVKIDGDGQMDPELIQCFVQPIIDGGADYTKGNRFYELEYVRSMPRVRLVGNAILSLMTKLSTGYWDLFDPTNGYTAIHTDVARMLPFDKISKRYFFESDMLFRLNTLRAVVVDIPMEARYDEEVSNLKVSKIVGEFLIKHARNFLKRIFYNYYLRDLSLASFELPIGLIMFLFGTLFGFYHWMESVRQGVVTPAGTVMLAALPILMGLQLLLAFIGYDIASTPRQCIYKRLASSRRPAK